MKILLILWFAFGLSGFSAWGEVTPSAVATNLPGAFGVVFGRRLPDETVISSTDLEAQINPPTPNPYLKRYTAKLNPVTKTVYELQGWYYAPNEREKILTFETLGGSLTGKYGPPSRWVPSPVEEPDSELREIGSGTIDLAYIKRSVVLTYTDKPGKELALKAIGELEAARKKQEAEANAKGL